MPTASAVALGRVAAAGLDGIGRGLSLVPPLAAYSVTAEGGAAEEEVAFGCLRWWVYGGVSCVLVLFAGMMSGLTLGMMSLDLVDLEVLQRGGTAIEKKQAAAILPFVQKQHQLLVTLLLCNAAAMEALPIFLDMMFNPYVAIILSVTFVLAFGEVIPQAICSRYGLAIGANCIWLVRVLMIICFPISYPIGKILDCVLGHSESALFRRAHLKALVSIHGQEAGKGGELTHDETTIISGALDLTEKTAEEAMTPIESTFSLDVDSKLDWEAIGKILARGHSRVPVYSGTPENIVGLLLVKSLLTVRGETETPVSAVSIRKMPRVPAHMPLYDILNEFQKGSSHMAAVVKSKRKLNSIRHAKQETTEDSSVFSDGDNSETVAIEIGKWQNKLDGLNDAGSLYKSGLVDASVASSEMNQNEQVIGIITLEDVFEELLQEEIVDETDEYVDVHKRIRVAAAAAVTSLGRSPSIRRLASSKGSQIRNGSLPGQSPRKSVEGGSASRRLQTNPPEPLHGSLLGHSPRKNAEAGSASNKFQTSLLEPLLEKI